MTDELLHQILDETFFDFETNRFENNGVWPRRANLIFAFADYIETLSDEDIAERLNSDDARLIKRFRTTAKQGIDKWLEENMKTLMF